MKKFFVVSLLALTTTTALANSPFVLKAVLDSEVISKMSSITKVEVVADYRCRNCHDFEVQGKNKSGPVTYFVHTEYVLGQIKVSVSE